MVKDSIMIRAHQELCDEIIDLQAEAKKKRRRMTQAQATKIIAQTFKKRRISNKDRIPNDSILGF